MNKKRKIQCEFVYYDWSIKDNVYTCKITNKTISKDSELEFIGKHKNSKANHHVEAIDFLDCSISRVPQGLTKIFPNLKFLQISRSGLESIEKKDLEEYKNLQDITVRTNEIRYLPGDLFAGMKNLIEISFNENKIEIIEPNLLDGLVKLKYVNFSGNLCINKCFESTGTRGNATLQEIKTEIREKFLNSPWKKLFDTKNQLEQTIAELKNPVQGADNKIKKLEQKNMEMTNYIKITDNKNQKMEKSNAELMNAVKVADFKIKKLEQRNMELTNLIKINEDKNQKIQQTNAVKVADFKIKKLEEKNQEIMNAATIANYENLKLKKTIEELRNGAKDNENIVSGICEDLQKIIQNKNLKDFSVQVDDTEFKVHKFLLAARSPVLREMIENNIDAECLNLVDISKEIFYEVLNFIYTDELPKSDDINYLHLFIAAGRLKIEGLKNFAAEKLMNTVNTENAFELLTLANKYESENLRQKSFKLIKNELNEYADTVTDDMAKNPEKLKIILNIKKEQEKMMQEMKLKLKIALNED